MLKARQGPMTAEQLQKVLARANNRQHDSSASYGTNGTNAYLLAWQWVSSSMLGSNTKPSGNPWEPWELESIVHTINKVQELVALED
jgi:hypothetical protein